MDRMDVHIGAAARQSGLTVDAVRYYESLDLIQGGRRDHVGRRVFTTEDVRWLVFLRKMRQTGMPIADLQEYVRCRRAGVAGVDGVLAVLNRHHHSVECCRVLSGGGRDCRTLRSSVARTAARRCGARAREC